MNSNSKSSKKPVILAVILTAALLIGGLGVYMKVKGLEVVDKNEYKEISRVYNKYQKLDSIMDTLDKEYLWNKDVKDDKLLEVGYQSMMASLGDKYTRYLTKEECDKLKRVLDNGFTGLGIVINKDKDGKILIVDVVKDGPAMSAGLKNGDEIISVDGKEYTEVDKMAKAMSGKAGTPVKLVYKRDGKEKEISVVRGEIETNSFESKVSENGICYVKINSFNKNTSKDFEEFIKDVESKNGKGIIIDIRDNPGGLMEEGVKVADLLLPECKICSTVDNKNKKKTYKSDSKHVSVPYVVLTNENTASAGEILAAAIKDNGGTLVGTNTFGKGLVQETILFKDGTGINVTIKEFFSPKGNKINGDGVEPTYKVERKNKADGDPQLKKAVEVINKSKSN